MPRLKFYNHTLIILFNHTSLLELSKKLSPIHDPTRGTDRMWGYRTVPNLANGINEFLK